MIIASSSIMPIPITALRVLPDRNRASTASASDCSHPETGRKCLVAAPQRLVAIGGIAKELADT
jgi:hypothetical protein